MAHRRRPSSTRAWPTAWPHGERPPRRRLLHVDRAWPRQLPYTFDWNERRRVPGYFTYEGDRNALVYAKEIGQRFKNQYHVAHTTDQLDGEFTLFRDAKNNRHYLAFRDTEGGIRESMLQGEEWAMTKPSELASAPQAKGDPIGWADAKPARATTFTRVKTATSTN